MGGGAGLVGCFQQPRNKPYLESVHFGTSPVRLGVGREAEHLRRGRAAEVTSQTRPWNGWEAWFAFSDGHLGSEVDLGCSEHPLGPAGLDMTSCPGADRFPLMAVLPDVCGSRRRASTLSWSVTPRQSSTRACWLLLPCQSTPPVSAGPLVLRHLLFSLSPSKSLG